MLRSIASWCAVPRIAFLVLLTLPLFGQKTHELCVACHQEQVADFKTHPHFEKGLSCDACHGASVKHRTAQGETPPDRVAAPDEVAALCGTCHGAEQKSYLTSKHAKLVMEHSKTRSPNCATCHGVHAPRAAAAIEAQCGRCHTALPEACKKPVAHTAKVSCLGCHVNHSMKVTGGG